MLIKSDLTKEIDRIINSDINNRLEIARLRAEIARLEANQLKPGEFVARWAECPRCVDGVICVSPGGCDMDGECIEAPVYEQCEFCNGTGHVAEPVEERK